MSYYSDTYKALTNGRLIGSLGKVGEGGGG